VFGRPPRARKTRMDIHPKTYCGESCFLDWSGGAFEPDLMFLQNVPNSYLDRMERVAFRLDLELTRQSTARGSGGEDLVEFVFRCEEVIDGDTLAACVDEYDIGFVQDKFCEDLDNNRRGKVAVCALADVLTKSVELNN
jgi:hypothetical protein